MSDVSIFRFPAPAAAPSDMDSCAFHQTALDPDASARLAAIDRALNDCENPGLDTAELPVTKTTCGSSADAAEATASSLQSELELQSQREDEFLAAMIADSAAAQSASKLATESSELDIAAVFSAAEVTCDSTNSPTSETSGSEISLIETAIADTNLDSETEISAPAALEVAPILDASGELQPGADDYVPPAPFAINVPSSLAVEETAAIETLAEPVAYPGVNTTAGSLDVQSDAPSEAPGTDAAVPNNSAEAASALIADASSDGDGETFDLDSLAPPSEAEEIFDKAIAQEEAVAEMSAAAAEFVAEQIAFEACVEAQAADSSALTEVPPCVPPTSEVAALAPSALADAAHALNAEPGSDRRRKRRALISSPIRVRSIDVTTSGPDEITTTVDVSRYGILFHTVLDTYQRGMDVAVVFPYHQSATGAYAEQFGRVVRLQDLPDGRHAVAVALGVGVGEHLVDSNGRKLNDTPVQLSNSGAPQVKRPLVLLADADDMLRDTMKMFLQNEGYEVIAVNNASDARETLNMFMPAMIVAEVEGQGEGLHGLDLCAQIKADSKLKHIPVVLTSRSAYPSDYSKAHSLGAVVCMAKPYKPERLGHIVRLLAPLPEHLQPVCTQRPPDPTRGFGRDWNMAQRPHGNGAARKTTSKKSNANGGLKNRFKFPSFR